MRVHVLTHVDFEGPGHIEAWAGKRGFSLAVSRMHADETPPSPRDFDLLAVMGGPMNVYEYEDHPWLAAERDAVGRAIASGRHVLGVCFGAQLLADILRGRVSRNPVREIGWHEVRLTPHGASLEAFRDFPPGFTALHWHGDTFSIPANAVLAAESDACPHQAFTYGDSVLGLQFHLETTRKGMEELITHGADDLVRGPFVQTPEAMREGADHCETASALCERLLDNFIR